MNSSCKNFQALIIDLRQGESLSPEDREALERHLAACPDCRAFQRDIVQMFTEMGDETLPHLSDEFFQEMRGNILRGLRENTPEKRTGLKGLLPSFSSFQAPWRGILVPLFSGVCGLLLGFLLATTRAPIAPPSKHAPAGTQIQKTMALKSPDDSTLVETLEDYVNLDEFLDSLDDQDMQVLLGELSNDLPEPLLNETENGTG